MLWSQPMGTVWTTPPIPRDDRFIPSSVISIPPSLRRYFLDHDEEGRANASEKGTEASEVKALIAIVDDDESVRVALAGLFRWMGLATEAFASAIEFLNSQHLSQTTCLILDVMMPGMNGIEFATFDWRYATTDPDHFHHRAQR